MKARRLLVEMEDGQVFGLWDTPEVIATNRDGHPYQIVMPGRTVTARDSSRPHLMMQVDDRTPVQDIGRPVQRIAAPVQDIDDGRPEICPFDGQRCGGDCPAHNPCHAPRGS